MVITCKFCRSRFRLNESLLRDAKSVRIRCGRCGGTIVIRNPAEHPTLPEDRMDARADLSGQIRPDPQPSVPEGDTVLLSSVPCPPLPRETETVPPGSTTEDKLPSDRAESSPVASGEPEGNVPSTEGPLPPFLAAAPDADLPTEHATGRSGEPAEPVEGSFPRPHLTRHDILLAVIAGLWILLLAGGALYFGATESGQRLMGKVFPALVSTDQGIRR